MNPESHNTSTLDTNEAKCEENQKSYPRKPQDAEGCLPRFYPCRLNNKERAIAEYLVELAKKGIDRTTYTDIGEIEEVDLPANSPELFRYLGTISWVTYHNEEVFLSVLVAREDEKIPGNGFFKMVAAFRERPYKESTNDEVFIDELKRVHEAAKEGKLDFILTGKTLK